MTKEIDYKKFEVKLLKIHPHLSSKKSKIIIEQLFIFWWEIIDNLDKFEK